MVCGLQENLYLYKMDENMLQDRNRLTDARDQYRQHKRMANKYFKQYVKEEFYFTFKYKKRSFFRRIAAVCLVLFLIVCPIFYFTGHPIIIEHYHGATTTTEIIYVADSTKTMDKFLTELGNTESGGNYRSVNQFGYMGKYQIGRQALTQLGLSSISNDAFLDNPDLQEASIIMLLKENKRVLAAYIGKYQNRVINGIYVTESGILAAANMCPQGIIDFLTSGGQNVFKDGNNCPITKYLAKFSGYQIKLK
jgi:hypothetical protein